MWRGLLLGRLRRHVGFGFVLACRCVGGWRMFVRAGCGFVPGVVVAGCRPGLSAGECAVDQVAVVVDEAGQEPEVDDGDVACRGEVDDLADGGGVGVAGDDERAGSYLGGVAGFVEEGPDVAGVVFVVEVSADVYAVHRQPSSRQIAVLAYCGLGCAGPRAASSALSSVSSAWWRRTV